MADVQGTWDKLATASGGSLRRCRVGGRSAWVLEPGAPAAGRPWVIYAPSFVGSYPTPRLSWIFGRLLSAGVTMAGVDVGESYGSPEGRRGHDALYDEATGRLGLASKVCLMPQSRGGLMLYPWASDHPERIAGVAGIYTVCDLRSYPGLAQAAPAYGLTADGLNAELAMHNPVDRLAPLARAGVPIWHLHGDADTVVPLEVNAGELVRRYRELGGKAELRVVPGYGHQEHPAFFERPELVAAVLRMVGLGEPRNGSATGVSREGAKG